MSKIVSVWIVMSSHLSDAQEEMGMGLITTARQRLNWVKYLINKYPDTSVSFDVDAAYKEYVTNFPHQAIKW